MPEAGEIKHLATQQLLTWSELLACKQLLPFERQLSFNTLGWKFRATVIYTSRWKTIQDFFLQYFSGLLSIHRLHPGLPKGITQTGIQQEEKYCPFHPSLYEEERCTLSVHPSKVWWCTRYPRVPSYRNICIFTQSLWSMRQNTAVFPISQEGPETQKLSDLRPHVCIRSADSSLFFQVLV